jgi:gas vesicle protein
MADDRGGAGGYLGWFLLGATLGGIAALLLTPKTGAENRGLLGERAGDLLDRGRELLEEQTQRLMGAFEAGRDAMVDEIRKMPRD